MVPAGHSLQELIWGKAVGASGVFRLSLRRNSQ